MTHLSPWTGHPTKSQQRHAKAVDSADISVTFYLNTEEECTFFSAESCDPFSQVDHIIGHNEIHDKYKKIYNFLYSAWSQWNKTGNQKQGKQ